MTRPVRYVVVPEYRDPPPIPDRPDPVRAAPGCTGTARPHLPRTSRRTTPARVGPGRFDASAPRRLMNPRRGCSLPDKPGPVTPGTSEKRRSSREES
jgi:hypothetical protein